MPKKSILILLCLSFGLFILLNVVIVSRIGNPLILDQEYNYFITGNFHNCAESLKYSLPELKKVIKHLNRGDNVFVSFMENGSTDKTIDLLKEFESSLDVPSKFSYCGLKSAGSWVLGKILGEHYAKKLFKMMPLIRYIRMAAIRNSALLPLKEKPFANNLPTKVIFLNDIFVTAEELLELISTNHGNYDMVCPLDFYYQFYDVLVARDSDGFWFSGFYPFTRHPESQLLMRENKPFKVMACWNGVIIMDADGFLQHNISFRGSVNNKKDKCECVQSECLLLCLDFYRAGFREIYVNPQVRVSYEWKYYMLHSLPIVKRAVEIYQSYFYQFAEEDSLSEYERYYRTDEGETRKVVGCSMPPYWEPENPREFMDVLGERCWVNLTEHTAYNENMEWEEFAHKYYEIFFNQLIESC
jgi:hypothetical protein